MRIATFNIRVTKPEDIKRGRAFIFRLPKILRNLKKVDADVIAFQEVQRLHITCLRLFLQGYKIHWAKWSVNGGTAIATKNNICVFGFFTAIAQSERHSAGVIIRTLNEIITIKSIHLSLNDDKLKDIDDIEIVYPSYRSVIVGDFNILADDDNHEVFKYLKEIGYKKLNEYWYGYHGYGDADKTPTTVDNFFTNFGELENIEVVDDKKASDHNLMYIDLKI